MPVCNAITIYLGFSVFTPRFQVNDVALSGSGTLRVNSGSTAGSLNLDGGATNHGGEINLFGGSNGGRILFRTGQGAGQQTEKMRLDENGRLIQRYSAAPYANRAATFQSPAGQGQTYVAIVNTETNGSCGVLFGDHAGQNAGNYDGYINYNHQYQHLQFMVNAGNERFRIASQGQLGIGGANYGTSGQVLTSSGSSSAPTWSTVASSNTSFKNLVINGSMQVAQRGTSSSSSGVKTIDRWTCNYSGGGVTQSQVSEQSGTAFENGFSNYLRITNTSNTTTDTDYRFIGHTMEAQFVANSGWNHKSSSSYVTLSAWVRSSLAGTYYGWLNSRDGSGHTYTFSYTLSANTWTKVTKTIPGNSNIAIHNNNEEGLVLHFIPWYGTYYSTSGHTLNAWQTSSSTNRCPDYSQNWANTSNATFDVTGVQLEVGDSASTFEFRSEAEELERCKRYFQKDLNRRAYWGSGNVGDRQFPLRFGVEMRDTPTISFTSTSLDSGSAAAYSVTRQGYNFAMTGSGRFYEWAHEATAEI